MSSQSTPTAKKGTPSKASSSAPKIPRVTFKTASKQTLKRYQQTNTLKELQQGIAKTKKAIELQSTSTNKGQQQSSPNSTGAPVTRSPANLGVKLAFSPRPQNDAERAVTFISKCLQEARNTKTAKTNFDNSKESFEDGGENVVGGTLSSIDKNDVIAADLIANSPWEANDLKTEDTELSSANLATKNTTPDQCTLSLRKTKTMVPLSPLSPPAMKAWVPCKAEAVQGIPLTPLISLKPQRKDFTSPLTTAKQIR
ncbi:hypothetical protein ACLKA6_017883 [Drosophila palustris]